MKPDRSLLLATCLLVSSPALAHTGHSTSDFAAGFLHPFGGIDHVLAMAGVGLFAATLSGRALWAVPAAFVAMMTAGGFLGFARVQVPGIEIGIAVSVIVIGALIALGRSDMATRFLPVRAAMATVAAFAIFHGYAHGSEMPATFGAAGYTSGFIWATILLHGIGVTTGLTAFHHRRLFHLAGIAIAASGFVILVA